MLTNVLYLGDLFQLLRWVAMPAIAMKLLDHERQLTVKIAGDSRLFSNRVSTMLALTITSAALLSAQSSYYTFPVAIYRGDESLVCSYSPSGVYTSILLLIFICGKDIFNKCIVNQLRSEMTMLERNGLLVLDGVRMSVRFQCVLQSYIQNPSSAY